MNPPLESLMAAFKQFQLVYVATKTGVVVALANGPKTLESLSLELKIPSVRLGRLLRALVWPGVLSCGEGDLYSLTEDGKKLVDQSPTSIAGGFRFQGDFFYGAWGKLIDYLNDGSVPFEVANGNGFFEVLAGDEALADSFNGAMAMRTSEYSEEISKVFSLSDGQTIVDVGGGRGRLVIDLLRHTRSLRGIIFDLPMLKAEAESLIQESAVADRCVFTPGDMFHAVPSDGDIYILKWLLHNWDDERSVKILKVVAKAMKGSARLFIIERLMPLDLSDALPLIQPDMNMLCLNGGAERTLEEYTRLASAAGLKIEKVLPFENQYGFLALQASKTN
jgi:hypothetical protein